MSSKGWNDNYFTLTIPLDENECASGSACGSASCENTIGGYSCSCPPGYVFDGNYMLCIGDFYITFTLHFLLYQLWLICRAMQFCCDL